MPRAFLANKSSSESPNCLANISILSRQENRALGGVAPSEYRAKMPSEVNDIVAAAICPMSLFRDEYDPFVKERAELLAIYATNLCTE